MIEGDTDDAQHTVSYVSDTILVNDIPIYTLLDTGATHSFLAMEFVIKWNFWALASRSYSVILPSGELIHSDLVIQGDIILMGDNKLYAELIILRMKGYDMILGMDWLFRHHAVIDCRSGRVNFRPLDNKE